MSKYNCNEHPVAAAVIDMINSCECDPQLSRRATEAIDASFSVMEKYIEKGGVITRTQEQYMVQLLTARQYLQIWDERSYGRYFPPKYLIDMTDRSTVRLIIDHKDRVAARRREESASNTEPDTD